ncbi:MAG: esterase-like activity of phytase family protein, partial [Sphingomicrobium sp.]
DSEALLRDSSGRGWWVAFESRNQVWLYDPQFNHALAQIDFGRRRWPRNRGIEGMTSDGGALLLFPERGSTVVEVRGSSERTFPIDNPAGRISEAARLPSGQLVVVNRHPTPLGFSNSIAVIERGRDEFHYGDRIRLGVSPLDNVEALAPERLPDGEIRLWLMTDDNFQRPLRTLLIALDWPVRRPPRSP